jgi:hypothetical protein
MTLDMQSHAVSLEYRAEPEPRRRSAFGRKPPLLFRAKLGHMVGRLGPLHANDEGGKHRFQWAKAAYKDSRRGSNPYLSAIIEQDEAPAIIDDCGGFFVSGVLFVALFGYNLPTA